MLKTVSSITNAIGALNFKGTWDANANSPALVSSVGTKGDYYVVGTAGTTNLNGISNWGVGDWATFNGSVWQRVEGGANLNCVDLSVSGTSTLSGLTASTALALNASKEVVSVTNTGTGNNVLATAPTLVGDVTLSTGNIVIGTAGKGVDFSATAGTGTSELLDDYEEGTWSPQYTYSTPPTTPITMSVVTAQYTKVGRKVTAKCWVRTDNVNLTGAVGGLTIAGLPFAPDPSGNDQYAAAFTGICSSFASEFPNAGYVSGTEIVLLYRASANGGTTVCTTSALATGAVASQNSLMITAEYFTAS